MFCPGCHGALEGQSGPGDRSLGGDRGVHRQGAGPSRDEGGRMRTGRGESEGLRRHGTRDKTYKIYKYIHFRKIFASTEWPVKNGKMGPKFCPRSTCLPAICL